jgi:hypothetical protein
MKSTPISRQMTGKPIVNPKMVAASDQSQAANQTLKNTPVDFR